MGSDSIERSGHIGYPGLSRSIESDPIDLRSTSSRRPRHATSTKDVHVKMKHGLAAARVRVDDRAIAGLDDLFLPRHFRGHAHDAADQQWIGDLVQRGNVLSRYDE